MSKAHLDQIVSDIEETRDSFDKLLDDPAFISSVSTVADVIIACLRSGNKIMLAGNGGSAADAQHIAGEFIGRFLFDRSPLPAIALTTDSSILTCVGNDYGFDKVFSRQVEALGKAGDILIAISTSGSSPSILNAMQSAKNNNITTIALTGCNVSKMLQLADHVIAVPDSRTPFIQQIHITVAHIICGIVERDMFLANS